MIKPSVARVKFNGFARILDCFVVSIDREVGRASEVVVVGVGGIQGDGFGEDGDGGLGVVEG